jgi:hypothetical protein
MAAGAPAAPYSLSRVAGILATGPNRPELCHWEPDMECIHHWKIASPNGPTAHGICRRCGAEREFPTVTDDTLWGDEEDRAARQERIRTTKALDARAAGASPVTS